MFKVIGFTAFLSLILSGCSAVHSHRVVNLGSQPIYDLEISQEGQTARHGRVNPRVWRSYRGDLQLGQQKTVQLRWQDANGQLVQRQVVLGMNQFNRVVLFEIDSDHNEVLYRLR